MEYGQKNSMPMYIVDKDDENAKKKCITQYIYADEENSAGEEKEADELYKQVRDLEMQLQSLELSVHYEKTLIKKEPHWELQCVDEKLRLTTEINSLEELMMYGNAAIRYLSPFGSVFQTKSIVFERMNISFVRRAMEIVSKSFNHINDSRSTSSPKTISKRFSAGVSAYWKPQSVVQRLIEIYFSCFNDIVPILHEPSFMEYYKSLEDPMLDPVILAVCTNSAISNCKHGFFNSYEKRYFSEYFFELSMEKLVDMFDDPEKALESVLVINLLLPFMVTTSRVTESFKWFSMATVLCGNLQKEYPDFARGDAYLPKMTRIKYSLIHRNSVLLFRDFITYDIRVKVKEHDLPFDILPDETAKTKAIFKIFNLLLKLVSHPAFIAVATARHLATGDIVELSLEEIIRYEETVVACDKAIQLVLHSADMCFFLMNQLEKIDSFCYSSTKISIRSIDSLMILLQVNDEKLNSIAKSKLNEHMHALTKRVAPDHRVSPLASPYSMLTVAPPGPTPSVAELYKNYPLPREALVFDVVRTIVEQNTDYVASST
ncbi:hypothetical protein INT46_003682 [Mucor plumbeus]|uniref:Uncharacterized protein n=1 Tax=Mucor plumbeus TaxID=97098 RepID=A0A8H7V9I0_9FUNG|nr:hypothetical protein INT46_003682 [Mucor plumbeus]